MAAATPIPKATPAKMSADAVIKRTETTGTTIGRNRVPQPKEFGADYILDIFCLTLRRTLVS